MALGKKGDRMQMSYFNCVWRRRQTVLLGAVALVCTPLFCQSQTPLNSMLRVVLQPTGDERGTVEARITNQSGKSISAFTIKLSMVNADRTVTTSLLNLDLLPSYASVTREPRITNKYQHFGPLANGGELYRIIRVGKAGTSADVISIVFDDNTIAGDKDWAQFNFDHHAAAAKELKTLVASLGNPSTVNLRNQIHRWKDEFPGRWSETAASVPSTRGASSGQSFARNFVISKLSEISRDSISDEQVADQFKEAISYFSDTAEDMENHTTPMEVKQ